MNGEILTGALRCSTRRKTHAQKTLPSWLLPFLTFILSAVPLVASAQNRALDFDGINDRIVLNSAKNVLNFGTSDFTIEFLIKTSTTAASSFVVTRSSGEGDRYIIGLSATGFLGAYYNLGGADDMALAGTTALNDGDWHHVAVVRQGPTVTAYIDGAFETSQLAPSPTCRASSRPRLPPMLSPRSLLSSTSQPRLMS